MQLGNYWAASKILDNLLRHFGYKAGSKVLWRNSFMISYLNQTLPSWGMGGMAYLILDLKKEAGVKPAHSMTSGIIYYALSVFSFFIILCLSFIGLAMNSQLKFAYLSAAFFAFVFVIAVSTVLVIFFFKRSKFKKIVAFLMKPVHALAHANSQSQENNSAAIHEAIETENLSAELQYTFRSLFKAGAYMWAALMWSFIFHFFDILTLFAFFMGFNFSISLSVLLGGFVLATVFGFVSFVPGAVGIFETSMALVYSSLGVPFQVATLTALAFRAVGFWLPIPIGGWLSKQFFHKTIAKKT